MKTTACLLAELERWRDPETAPDAMPLVRAAVASAEHQKVATRIAAALKRPGPPAPPVMPPPC